MRVKIVHVKHQFTTPNLSIFDFADSRASSVVFVTDPLGEVLVVDRFASYIKLPVSIRKVSFGSQSTAGAKARSALLSVLFTAKKRLPKKQAIEKWFHQALDAIAKNPQLNIFDLLPKNPP